MAPPTFTALIKAHNEEDWIASAIHSVLAQTREDFELVVVDDGSTDGTAEVVKKFQVDPRVRLISQENRGVAKALNAGIAASVAPYVSLIDADDLWMPTYLEELGRALDADPGAGFAYTDAWCLDHARGRFWRISSNSYMGEPEPLPTDPKEFLTPLLERNFVFGLATVRRSALLEVGNFDESLRAGEDYELWLRLLNHGYRAARAPGRLAIVRDRKSALHTDEQAMLRHLRDVYQKVADDAQTSGQVAAIARRRVEEVDGEYRALRPGWTGRVLKFLRRQGGSLRRAVLNRDFWYSGTPPEVASAFPDILREKSRGA